MPMLPPESNLRQSHYACLYHSKTVGYVTICHNNEDFVVFMRVKQGTARHVGLRRETMALQEFVLQHNPCKI